MKMTLKGDYFNSRFSHPEGPNLGQAQERILKKSPADLTETLWETGVYYDHIDGVIESAQKGFDVWRKLSFEERINFLKKYQEASTTK